MTDPVDPPNNQPGAPNPPPAPRQLDPNRDQTTFPTSDRGDLDPDILTAAEQWAARLPPAPAPGAAPDQGDSNRDRTAFPTSEPLTDDPDIRRAALGWPEPPPSAAPPGEDPSRPDGLPPTAHIDLDPGTAEPGPDDPPFTPPASSGDLVVTLPGGGETVVPGAQTIRMPVAGVPGAELGTIFEDGAKLAEQRRQAAAPKRWNVVAGLLGLAAVLAIIVFALFGSGFGGGASPAPGAAGSSGPVTSGAGASEAASGNPTASGPTASAEGQSPVPGQTQAGPPPQVIIAQNEITFGQAATFDAATTCKDGGTVTFVYKIAGIAPNTPVAVQVTGPGVSSPLTFTATSDVPVTRSFAFPPGGGQWTSTIVSIGGNAPPSSGSHASTVIQCSP